MGRFLKYLLSFLLLLPGASGAAFPTLPGQELVWKNVSVQGRRMSVYCIFRDSRDIVWLGTNNGLFFYDGVTTHAVSDDGLSGNPTYATIERQDGLLLGTGNGLINFSFTENRFSLVQLDPSPGDIRCLHADGDTIWIGSMSGAYALDFHSGKLTDCSAGLPHHSVYSLVSDDEGALYAGTYDGLARWDATLGSFCEIPLPEGRSRFVNCLLESQDGQSIYVGTEDALYVYSQASGFQKRDGISGNVKCLAHASGGRLLVGTDHGLWDISVTGAVRHYFHDMREDQTLSNSEIWCVSADGNDNIWVGNEVGFSVASSSPALRTVKLSAITGTGEGNDIHSIFRDSRGNLWIGGTNGIIRLSDGSAPRWYMPTGAAHSLSHVHIRNIFEDSHGTVWLPTDGGLNRYNAATDDFDVFRITDRDGNHATNWVYAIEEYGDGYLVGGYLSGMHAVSGQKLRRRGGVVVSNQAVNTSEPFFNGLDLGLNNDLVHQIIKDATGNIWIFCFSDGILTQVLPDASEVKRWDIGQMAGGSPSLVAIDENNRLWCAFKGGVVLFSPDPHVVRFPRTDTDESVLSMAPVGEDLWVSTVSNIWRVDGNSLEAELLPIPQQTYKALYYDTCTRVVYLGGNDMVAQADPSLLSGISAGPSFRMILSGRQDGSIDMRDVTPGPDGLTVPYGGSVTLLVSTLDYSPDSSPRQMYKLAGAPDEVDGGWTILPEGYNTISLPELKAGRYYLLLKLSGSPEDPFVLPVRVLSPWYLRWWAFALYVIAIAVLLELARRLIRKRKEWLLNLRNRLMEAIRIEALTQGKPIEALSLHEKQLAKVSRIIEDHIDDPDLNVSFLCGKSGLPEKQIYRVVKKYMDVGPSEYIRNVRLGKAAGLLAQDKFTVSEVCYMVGFKTPSYFTKCFQEKYGVKPSQYKKSDVV